MNTDSAVVLLVDPYEDAAEMYTRALNRFGFQVLVAPNAEAALRLVSQLVPDAVVTELALPTLSGVELIQQLLPLDVPIIVLTASLFSGPLDEPYVSCDALLLKPVLPDVLADEIRRVLNLKLQTRAAARARVCAEYAEMPGMRLRAEQVQRLCGIERSMCQRVLETLVAERVLIANADGTYVRTLRDGDVHARRLAGHAKALSRQ